MKLLLGPRRCRKKYIVCRLTDSVVIGMPFCICLPNFVVIRWSLADLWRHIHFFKMAAGSHIGIDLGNVRPPSKCNCHSHLDPQIGLDPIYSFGDIAIFLFCSFGLKFFIHAHFWGVVGRISPSWSPIVQTPKTTIPAWKHVVWATKLENRSSGSTWA